MYVLLFMLLLCCMLLKSPLLLPPTPTLSWQLDLRGNALGNNGAILISRGLRAHENDKLAELDMGYNEVKDDGACALAQVQPATCMCSLMARLAGGAVITTSHFDLVAER